MLHIGLDGLWEYFQVIFANLKSIFAISQSLGKRQKCLILAWMAFGSKNDLRVLPNAIHANIRHFCHHFCIFAIFVFVTSREGFSANEIQRQMVNRTTCLE